MLVDLCEECVGGMIVFYFIHVKDKRIMVP